MTTAYYVSYLFEKGNHDDCPGIIYRDNDLIAIEPSYDSGIQVRVVLDSSDIVELVRLALPIFDTEEIQELATLVQANKGGEGHDGRKINE